MQLAVILSHDGYHEFLVWVIALLRMLRLLRLRRVIQVP
jgi:hypothetical protein